MTLVLKAFWDPQAPRQVDSLAELDSVVAEVSALAKPAMLFLEAADGRMLVVGIGGEESVLTFVESDGTTFHSVGDVERPGVLQFWCRDQVDDFLAEMAVSAEQALEATRQFLATGRIPDSVQWEPDW